MVRLYIYAQLMVIMKRYNQILEYVKLGGFGDPVYLGSCSLTYLFNILIEFFNRNQRNKLKLDNLSLPSPERHRPLRHQMSSDNMHVPPFNIPNLRIEQRKTSSAEDMARKNSAGMVFFLCSILLNRIPNRKIFRMGIIEVSRYLKSGVETKLV